MKKITSPWTLALACAGLLWSQGTPDQGKLLTTFQNPVGDLISVPFQNNINFPIGEFSRVQDVLNIQPVVPIPANEDWLVISRWITPVVYQPNLGSSCRTSGELANETCEARESNSAQAGGANGLGDLNPSFFLSPARPGKLIWGLGPAFLMPTATDPTLGQGKWGAGPSIVLLTQPQHWTLGFLSNNVWSFAGNKGRPRVNQFLTQYFVTRNMEHGWFVTSSPILTANWRAQRDNQWLIPFGGGFGKITRFFDQPMVWQIHAYYNAIHPRDLPYPKWQVRLQVALLFPTAK
ncbi:MAG TPA: neuromedin U [Bryobacteraceae bacterium]|nr:neuromedin U [Bryobacteraceae bacterium]